MPYFGKRHFLKKKKNPVSEMFVQISIIIFSSLENVRTKRFCKALPEKDFFFFYYYYTQWQLAIIISLIEKIQVKEARRFCKALFKKDFFNDIIIRSDSSG